MKEFTTLLILKKYDRAIYHSLQADMVSYDVAEQTVWKGDQEYIVVCIENDYLWALQNADGYFEDMLYWWLASWWGHPMDYDPDAHVAYHGYFEGELSSESEAIYLEYESFDNIYFFPDTGNPSSDWQNPVYGLSEDKAIDPDAFIVYESADSFLTAVNNGLFNLKAFTGLNSRSFGTVEAWVDGKPVSYIMTADNVEIHPKYLFSDTVKALHFEPLYPVDSERLQLIAVLNSGKRVYHGGSSIVCSFGMVAVFYDSIANEFSIKRIELRFKPVHKTTNAKFGPDNLRHAFNKLLAHANYGANIWPFGIMSKDEPYELA